MERLLDCWIVGQGGRELLWELCCLARRPKVVRAGNAAVLRRNVSTGDADRTRSAVVGYSSFS